MCLSKRSAIPCVSSSIRSGESVAVAAITALSLLRDLLPSLRASTLCGQS